ncbi:YqcC family protein [Candidatus Pantoea multigeneris]|uniref:YqcC-like domain-containing protein n=1 Tax=Candidatus Pantoea multigeneris TaxID=2608357 RepID=A0ABX0RD15_9GAMM|nr:YqcC family protein [Pantoea multigeneris]NIF23250.1 hypothetical protein [Pantoea multigeneris]
MTLQQLLQQRLIQAETLMREHQLWQLDAPAAESLVSDQPFCLDKLEPLEWLQWIFIPRMQALLDANAPLPMNFAITPYYEVALPDTTPGHGMILLTLKQIDALFVQDSD